MNEVIIAVVASVMASLLVGASTAWIVFRVRFERFESMDTRREKDWSTWREEINERLRTCEQKPTNGYAGVVERLSRAERDILDLRQWKHEKATPYLHDMNSLNKRVEHVEGEIGRSHDTGLRGGVHKASNALTALAGRVLTLEQQRKGNR